MICPICHHSDTDKPRSVQQNKLYWSMLELVSDHAEAPVFQGKDGPENLHNTIKKCLGYVKNMYNEEGEFIGVMPESMAFHKKDAKAFNAYFDKVQTFIFEKILPNVERESFERELCNMLRIPTMEDYQ